MSRDVFERAIAYARTEGLAVQVLCGPDGLPQFVREALAEQPAVIYAPVAACSHASDVPIVNTAGPPGTPSAHPMARIEAIAAGRHAIGILRLARSDVGRLVELWQALAARVERVVLVPLEVDRYDEPTLGTYRAQLGAISSQLAAAYAAGAQPQLNVLSDRMALGGAMECGAGVIHVTVDPAGRLFICPGFAARGAPPVGDLDTGPILPNGQLLRRDHAPICQRCDAFQCRRCVYMNERATLELNTPPQRVCRTAHAERDQSRLLLEQLHAGGLLERLPPIPALEYDDPLEVLLGRQRRPTQAPPGAKASRPVPEPKQVHEHVHVHEQSVVGVVTSEERDRIRSLFLRKAALAQILRILAGMDAETLATTPLYEKIVRDMGETEVAFQGWWDEMIGKYGWGQRHYRIEFETCEIFLEHH